MMPNKVYDELVKIEKQLLDLHKKQLRIRFWDGGVWAFADVEDMARLDLLIASAA